MEQNGQTARWGTGLDHHRTLGWPSCEHIGMIVGVLGQPAELRRSQGGKRAGRSANRGWTSLGGQGSPAERLGVMLLGITAIAPRLRSVTHPSRTVTAIPATGMIMRPVTGQGDWSARPVQLAMRVVRASTVPQGVPVCGLPLLLYARPGPGTGGNWPERGPHSMSSRGLHSTPAIEAMTRTTTA